MRFEPWLQEVEVHHTCITRGFTGKVRTVDSAEFVIKETVGAASGARGSLVEDGSKFHTTLLPLDG